MMSAIYFIIMDYHIDELPKLSLGTIELQASPIHFLAMQEPGRSSKDPDGCYTGIARGMSLQLHAPDQGR